MKDTALQAAYSFMAGGMVMLVIVYAGWIGMHRDTEPSPDHAHITSPCFEDEVKIDLAWYDDDAEPQTHVLCIPMDDIMYGRGN